MFEDVMALYHAHMHVQCQYIDILPLTRYTDANDTLIDQIH